MRQRNTYKGTNNKAAAAAGRRSRTAQKTFNVLALALLFVLVFSLALVAVVGGANGKFNVAEAALQNGKAVSQSTAVSTTGTAFFTSPSKADFYVDSDDSNAVSGTGGFGNYSKHGWGWSDDYECDDYKRFIFWLQIDFSGNMLTDVANGNVSYYVYAHGGSTTNTDDIGMGVSFTSTTPSYTWVPTSNDGAWTSTAQSNMKDCVGLDDTGSKDYSFGKNGGYDSSAQVPKDAKSMRIIFGVQSDGNCCTGWSNISIRLYKYASTSITSSDTTFDLSNGLYGDELSVLATETNNVEYKLVDQYHGGSITAANYTMSYQKAPEGQNTWENDGHSFSFNNSYAGVVVLGGSGNNWNTGTYTLKLTIKLNSHVTKIKVSSRVRIAQSKKGTPGDCSTKATLTAGSTEIGSKSSTTFSTGSYSELSKTIDVSSTSVVLTLTIEASKDDGSGFSDYQGFAVFWGGIKITTYGEYYVKFNANGGSGTAMSDQTLIYGTSSTLTPNTYKNGSLTFGGWATSSTGNVAYKDGASVSNLTKVPGDTINLYAKWFDTDFGVKSGKSKTDGTWGSSTNPFVIENATHWLNLMDIVNKARDPVDSVTDLSLISGTKTAAKSLNFSGAYFLLAADIGESSSLYSFSDKVGASTTNCFAGNLDGDGHGIYFDMASTATYSGLFGYIIGTDTARASVKNLTVGGQVVSSTYGIGGLAGQAQYADFENVTVTANVICANYDEYGNVTTNSYIGGIAGYVSTGACTFKNCTYTGGTKYTHSSVTDVQNVNANIFGSYYIGGIVGYASVQATFDSCKVTAGTIVATSNTAGGIVGYTNSTLTITGCSVSSGVNVNSSSTGAGGIMGSIGGSGALTIQNCENAGTVSANANGVAGILGHTANGYSGTLLIKGCKSTGKIEGGSNVGGIGGRIESSGAMTVENCYTSGTIACHTSADHTNTFGGIIGYFFHNATSGNAVIRYCASSCTITLKGTVENGAGGIAGNFTNGAEKTDDGAPKVSYCYSFVTLSNSGTVDRNNLVGGVVGTSLNNHTVENSWYFKSSSTDTAANNNVFNTTSEPTKYGRYAIVLGSTGSTYFKPILSTETSDWSSTSWSATVTWTAWDDWTKITEKNYDGFANKYSNLTQPNNSTYIRCTYGSKEGDAFKPDYVVSEHVARDFDNAKSNFAVGFKATIANNIFVQRVAIEHTPDDSTSSASAATFTYNGSSQNITLTAPDTEKDTFYTVEYQYLSPENAVIDATDVKNAGTYTVKLNIVIADYVVGMKTIALTISPKSLSVSQKWTDNATTYPTHADFVYNTNHQGLSTVTITGVVDTDSYESIFEIICNNGASFSIANKVYTFSGAIDVNNYQIAVKIISENYKWLSSDTEDPSARTYKWAITPKPIDIGKDIVFGYAFDEAEKFMNPGEMLDSSGKVVLSGGTYYTLNSSFAHI